MDNNKTFVYFITAVLLKHFRQQRASLLFPIGSLIWFLYWGLLLELLMVSKFTTLF